MLSIIIAQKNAAFDDRDQETARILRALAVKVEDGCVECTILDANGNGCGKMAMIDED